MTGRLHPIPQPKIKPQLAKKLAEVFYRRRRLRLTILGLQFCILLGGQVAGAVLGYAGELAVTEDTGVRVICREVLEEFVEGMLLSLSTRIDSTASLVKTAFVDDAQ